ncbi:hypothetical protein GWI33_010236 [Rhynchophorus ferrugineus]|uniref:Uncharacterized protein n=1 Tax=Rhynchophorus ferrugineus TaxID=354439 RepID=A0A834IC15_RHYFE|nr:hypothetical protein GWI33_010236 [Rhynchophorus ferrugineus]
MQMGISLFEKKTFRIIPIDDPGPGAAPKNLYKPNYDKANKNNRAPVVWAGPERPSRPQDSARPTNPRSPFVIEDRRADGPAPPVARWPGQSEIRRRWMRGMFGTLRQSD